MNPGVYACIFLMLFIVISQQRNARKNASVIRHRLRNRKERSDMLEILERYLGKDCVIHTLNDQVSGTITQISDGWILVDNGKNVSAVNAEYVLCVQESRRKTNR